MTRILITLASALLLGGCARTDKSAEMNTATATTGQLARADWDLARQQTIFFGHQSIGENILDGLSLIATSEGWPAFQIVEGDLPPGVGAALLHNKIGENGDPISKISGFRRGLEAGVGSRANIAVMKFCFWDVRAETDVQKVFDEYRAMVASVGQQFPRVTLLHATVPLVVRDNDWRARVRRMLGKPVPTDLDNARREALNRQLRSAYGDRVFDIALAETDPAVPPASSTPYLADDFSSDGAHLNPAGRRQVAAAFVRSLAAAARAEARP